jgi:hypothetical protein
MLRNELRIQTYFLILVKVTMEVNAGETPNDQSKVPHQRTPQRQSSETGPMLGENLQNTAEHGEYLTDFPILSILLNFTEMVSFISTIYYYSNNLLLFQ